MIEKIEKYLKDKFGNVEIITLLQTQDKSLYQCTVNFRNLVIVYTLNTNTNQVKTELRHKENWEFKEFDDIIIFRSSMNVIIETLEDLIKMLKENK